MIWKEMKRQHLSNADLAVSLGISKSKAQAILTSPSIDTETLISICELMRFNFFQLYDDMDVLKKLKKQSKEETSQEIERLKNVITEKNKVIDLKDQLLKAQNNMVVLLEKGRYQ